MGSNDQKRTQGDIPESVKKSLPRLRNVGEAVAVVDVILKRQQFQEKPGKSDRGFS